MKHFIKLLFFVFILFPLSTKGQNFYGGIIGGVSYLSYESTKEKTFKADVTYKLLLGLKATENFSFELRGGYSYPNINYGGYEIGVNLAYKILSRLSIFSGYQLHMNDDIGHNSKIIGNNIQSLSLGLNYGLVKSFLVELNYNLPLEREYAFYENYDDINPNKSLEIFGIISLNFIAAFNF